MFMYGDYFGIMVCIVIIVFIVVLVNRFRAGSKVKAALKAYESIVSSYNSTANKFISIQGQLKEAMQGNRNEKTINKLLDEYKDSYNYLKEKNKELHEKQQEAYNNLEKLRIAQNLTGGANDIGAIPYYLKSKKMNSINNTVKRVDIDEHLFIEAINFIKK